MGNMTEVSADSLVQEYGPYLIDGETIQTGFKLIRDAVVITDLRIPSFQRMRVDSI